MRPVISHGGFVELHPTAEHPERGERLAALHAASPHATPFTHPGWAAAWWTHFGAGARPFTVVVSSPVTVLVRLPLTVRV